MGHCTLPYLALQINIDTLNEKFSKGTWRVHTTKKLNMGYLLILFYHKLTEVVFVYVNMHIIFKILAVVQNKSNFV